MDFDFSKTKNAALNYAVIYGENGSGKTNLIQSVGFLKESISTLVNKSKNIGENKFLDLPDISQLCASVKTINSKEPMVTEYVVDIDNSKFVYTMEFADNFLVREELKKKGVAKDILLFSISNECNTISKNIKQSLLIDGKYRNEIMENINRLWGKHSFLSIMNAEYDSNNREYMDSKTSTIDTILNYIDMISVNTVIVNQLKRETYSFLDNVEYGIAKNEEVVALKAYGYAMSRFFRRIYSDVDDVYYDIDPDTPNIVKYKLYFMKKIDGESIPVPSIFESSGTRKLVMLFKTLLSCVSGGIAFIDEIDSGVHDVLIYELMMQILPNVKGQLIFTTHNTSILKITEPKSTFVIDIDADGYKVFKCIREKKRTQKNNNNQLRYANNAFGGIPIIDVLDLEDVAEELYEKIGEI